MNHHWPYSPLTRGLKLVTCTHVVYIFKNLRFIKAHSITCSESLSLEIMFTHVEYAQENEKYACAKRTVCCVFCLFVCFTDLHTGETKEICISTSTRCFDSSKNDITRINTMFNVFERHGLTCLCHHQFNRMDELQ